MKRSLIAAALVAMGLFVASGAASAQVRAGMGRLEYEANCLACHGKEGKGDGYYGRVINVKVPDITTIAKRNGGTFPVEKVMMLIDGREVPLAHGVRQMPIWGIDYSLKSAEIYKNFPTHDPETYVRVRILALVDYIYQLQGALRPRHPAPPLGPPCGAGSGMPRPCGAPAFASTRLNAPALIARYAPRRRRPSWAVGEEVATVDQRVSASKAQRLDTDPLFDPARFEAAFDRSFSLVAFMMNRHLVDHMVRTSRRFGIDFETLVIWAVVAHQNAAHLLPPGSSPSSILNDVGRLPATATPQLRPLRLRDVTQITGIPRETARRKLKSLGEAGWLLDTKAGWVLNRDRTDPDLRGFTLETARRFLATANDIVQALRDADRAR